MLIPIIAGLSAGTMAGLFGVGGNAILIPFLVFGMGMTQHAAQGLSLAITLPPLGLPAFLNYRSHGIRPPLALIFRTVIGFVLAVPLGSLVANMLPVKTLRILFAGLLFYNAVRIGLRSYRKNGAAVAPQLPPVPSTSLLYVFAGAASGFAAGLLGVGGALVLIPLLRMLRLNQQEAQATSLATLIAPVALPGVLVYWETQPAVPWALVIPIAIAFAIGGVLGARVARKMSLTSLERAFAVFVACIGTATLVSAIRS